MPSNILVQFCWSTYPKLSDTKLSNQIIRYLKMQRPYVNKDNVNIFLSSIISKTINFIIFIGTFFYHQLRVMLTIFNYKLFPEPSTLSSLLTLFDSQLRIMLTIFFTTTVFLNRRLYPIC